MFAALVALLALEIGARLAPPAWWEAGQFKEHWLDARIIRAVVRSGDGAQTTPPRAGSEDRGDLVEGVGTAFEDASGIVGEHSYNRAGYRGPSWPDRPTRGVKRVAVLGDSRIFGLYVGAEETVAARISARPGHEGLNFGVTGAGTFEALDYIVDDALATAPTAAVLLFDINPSVLALTPAARWSKKGTLAQVLRGSALVRRTDMLARHAVRGRDGRVPSVDESEYAAQYVEVIDRLRSGGVQQIVVLIGVAAIDDRPGVFSRARYDRYRQAAREIARSKGARAIEVESFVANLPAAEAYRGIGIHWSPAVLDGIAAEVVRSLGAPSPRMRPRLRR